jgi:hydroxymethylpyrimidine pyrophosphatase-like HAD family hydrolase
MIESQQNSRIRFVRYLFEKMLDHHPLPDEVKFYSGYGWTLSPYLTVRHAIEHLDCEITKLQAMPSGWQHEEIVTNVYLLSCGLLNCIEEYLRGPASKLPSRLAGIKAARSVMRALEVLSARPRVRRLGQVLRWRERWLIFLHDFLSRTVSEIPDAASIAEAGVNLGSILKTRLPADLMREQVRLASPFRHHDLTHHDVIAMGERYLECAPRRAQKMLLVGLRTSGSYFVPLLRAFFGTRGYSAVSLLTLNPKKGASIREWKEMKRHAEQGYSAIVVDDSPDTGGTLLAAMTILRRAGFGQNKVKIVIPAHRARPDLHKQFPQDLVISHEPDQWRKCKLLEAEAVQKRLSQYFGAPVTVSTNERVEAMNAQLRRSVSDERGTPLKQIFEVCLDGRQRQGERRFILAKSVGWGWLGYHAFLAGYRLSNFVPPVLGLRDGILYTEWLSNDAAEKTRIVDWRDSLDTVASYIATRTRKLRLQGHAVALVGVSGHDNGVRLLKQTLCKAYGCFPTNIIAQRSIRRSLRGWQCNYPTLIDGNMRLIEWLFGGRGLLKVDYEHHGLGKSEVNTVDPGYDLAQVVLDWKLSASEERRLIERYVEESGDADVERRLMLNKLLAGLWTMKQAHEHLFANARLAERQQEFHRQFMAAWDFLTIQFARFCGSQCTSETSPNWNGPLTFLDLDGVFDRRPFGFPTTSAAGIEALRLLLSHGLSVALNTARSVSEVKAYCEAYSLAGGVAEHGGYIWDAVNRRGRSLISEETTVQFETLRNRLRQMPGVFLDDRHQYSIRAFTYLEKPRRLRDRLANVVLSRGVGDGVVAPLSTLLVGHLFAELGLDRLSFHHTEIDTTIVAAETDKGCGLLALRDWVSEEKAETIAIGDGRHDLAMFRVASRSFAPANIGCAREAQLFGCRIVNQPYQRGLLEIAEKLTLPESRKRKPGPTQMPEQGAGCDLLMELLQAADRTWARNLMGVYWPKHSVAPNGAMPN